MAKKQESLSQMIESHRPKNFKHKYLMTDDILRKLEEENYDLSLLDTIHNDELTQLASEAKYKEYDSSIIGKADEPTSLEDGIILSKRMVTKVGKKLLSIGVGRFFYNDIEYVSIRMHYELFDIIEIFILN